LQGLAQTNNLATLYEKSLPSILKVETFDKNNTPLNSGTGFFINPNGKGISNLHVFRDAFSYYVTTSQGIKYKIDSLWVIADTIDLVLFSIENKDISNLPFLKIDNKLPLIGDNVFTIGNPIGLDFSISSGIISSIRNHPRYGVVYQTNTPISPGNSGSPLLTTQGSVIGVITFTFTEGQNINFALSIVNKDIKGNLTPFEPRSSLGSLDTNQKQPNDRRYSIVKGYHQFACMEWRFFIDYNRTMYSMPSTLKESWPIHKMVNDQKILMESNLSGFSEGDIVGMTAIIVINKNLTYVFSFGTDYSQPESAEYCLLMVSKIQGGDASLIYNNMVKKERIQSYENRFLEFAGFESFSLIIEDQINVRAISINDPEDPIQERQIYFLSRYKIFN